MIDVAQTRTRIGALGVLATVAALWILLAPTQLGGPTSFATITGVSMEPRLHAGDLVVLRRSNSYHVGEVVAYRNAMLNRIVLHRIIAIDGGRYSFKGDNNDFVDPGTAGSGDLVGRQWLHLPGAGKWFQRFHSPWVAALLAALAVVALVGTGKVPRRRGARGRRAAVPTFGVPPGLEPLLRPVITLAAAAAVFYLLLTAVALGLPTSRAVIVPNLYEETGTFAYGGAAPVSAAYPSGRVASGGTVFTRLVRSVDTSFRWQLTTKEPHAIAGTASLGAVVADGSGWSRRVALSPPRTFSGDRTRVGGKLDLAALQSLVAAFESETGTTLSQYRVSLVPRVHFSGVVGGRQVTSTYAPTLDLVLSDEALQLATSNGTPSAGLVRSDPQSGTASAPNRMGFGPIHLAVGTARGLGVGGLLLSLLVLAGAAAAARTLEEQDPVERELARSGQQVVRIADERRAARLVDVRHLAGLLRIARRYDRLVLFAERTGAYLVEDDDIVYRWRRPGSDGTPPAEEQPVFVERRDLRTRPWALQPEEEPFAEAADA